MIHPDAMTNIMCQYSMLCHAMHASHHRSRALVAV